MNLPRVGLTFGMAMLDHARTVEAAVRFEQDYDTLWIPDSQYLYRDCYVLLSGVASNTSQASLGTLLTSPAVRHPSVIASAAATISEMTGRPLKLGLGTGDSAVRRAGMRPQRVAEFRESIRAIRRFRDESEADWPAPDYEIHVAATGDRALGVAKDEADGAILNVGVNDAALGDRIQRVREGDDSKQVSSFNFVAVADSVEEARRVAKPSVSWFGINNPRLLEEVGLASPAMTSLLDKFRGDYENFDLVHATDWEQAMEIASPLPDELVDEFAVFGTADDVATHVARLGDFGIDEVIVRPPTASLWSETADALAVALQGVRAAGP